jgi:transposase-like protein
MRRARRGGFPVRSRTASAFSIQNSTGRKNRRGTSKVLRVLKVLKVLRVLKVLKVLKVLRVHPAETTHHRHGGSGKTVLTDDGPLPIIVPRDEPLYPVVFFEALCVKIRDEGLVRSKAAWP